MLKKILLIFIVCMVHGIVQAHECCFENFFQAEYKNAVTFLPAENTEKDVFNIIYNAYAIKFQGLQFEYDSALKKYDCLLDDKEADKEDIKFQKEVVNSISDMAFEEYAAFIEDINFEISGFDRKLKNRLDRSAKRSKKEFKKLLKHNCKKGRFK